jgi:DNA mismatch endonuclease (patch repair protein)
MAKVHRRDTGPEVRLRRELWRRSFRGWRCDLRGVPGRPDIAFTRWRVAVFVDGRLWHGHPTRFPRTLSEEWRNKIERNIERDKLADAMLREAGWVVLRVWDHEVISDLDGCINRIEKALAEAKVVHSIS